MKYIVNAEMVTNCYLEVEANNEEEALAIAENTDGGEFVTDDDPNSGSWIITDAVLKEEKEEVA